MRCYQRKYVKAPKPSRVPSTFEGIYIYNNTKDYSTLVRNDLIKYIIEG